MWLHGSRPPLKNNLSRKRFPGHIAVMGGRQLGYCLAKLLLQNWGVDKLGTCAATTESRFPAPPPQPRIPHRCGVRHLAYRLFGATQTISATEPTRCCSSCLRHTSRTTSTKSRPTYPASIGIGGERNYARHQELITDYMHPGLPAWRRNGTLVISGPCHAAEEVASTVHPT